ncbi:MAG: hypothetical protein JKY94_07770 [Rhodobacteraceae bacterium]|nr:hypothetical protein [Paracoccaceae bacterium]
MNIWTVTDPKAMFEGIFDDPAYLEHVPFRNSVFVMGESTMFVLTPNK